MSEQEILLSAFRNNPGGVGDFLSERQKETIRKRQRNHAENKDTYDLEKLAEGADTFFENHPIEPGGTPEIQS